MLTSKQILFSLLAIALPLTSFAQSVPGEITIKSAQASNGVYIKVSPRLGNLLVFQTCLTNGTSEICNILGRDTGYTVGELKSRQSNLELKGYARLGAKIASPILGMMAGSSLAVRLVGYKSTSQIRDFRDIAGAVLIGGPAAIFGGAIGLGGGFAGILVIDKATADYSDAAAAIAKTFEGTGQPFVVTTQSIQEVIANLSYALAGI